MKPQSTKCVCLARRCKRYFQNCLLWSKTSTALLFLPRNDMELPRRHYAMLRVLLGPTCHRKASFTLLFYANIKQLRIQHFTWYAQQMHSIHPCPHQLQRLWLKGEMQMPIFHNPVSCTCAPQINTCIEHWRVSRVLVRMHAYSRPFFEKPTMEGSCCPVIDDVANKKTK